VTNKGIAQAAALRRCSEYPSHDGIGDADENVIVRNGREGRSTGPFGLIDFDRGCAGQGSCFLLPDCGDVGLVS
jgi:hypothetical protein